MKILQLVGSPTSTFYEKLSCLYAKDSIAALSGQDFIIAYIDQQGWRFPHSLDQQDIDRCDVLSLWEAIHHLTTVKPDLALPQMFCLAGMTTYRSLLDLLNIPYIGNTPDLMALTADKAKTKTIVADRGVKVPKGEIIKENERPSLSLPVVVKPLDSDNSVGVSFVAEDSEYEQALKVAFAESSRALVEEFIPGREVRCGILDIKGELICLPLEEYLLNDRYPIRTADGKLKSTDQGELYMTAKDPTKSWIVENDPITPIVWEAAKLCHRALGCRHYSLFDFRISPAGVPYFLEAGLYCSFAPKSVIITMARSIQMNLEDVLTKMIQEITEPV